MKRDVIHDGLQPSVPVSIVSDVSGGSCRRGSIAAGIRFLEDIGCLSFQRVHVEGLSLNLIGRRELGSERFGSNH